MSAARAVQRPMRLPDDAARWNRARRGAFKRGVMDFHAGKSAAFDCPYKDKRTAKGAVTFSRAYVNAWHDGFSWAQSGEDIIQDA